MKTNVLSILKQYFEGTPLNKEQKRHVENSGYSIKMMTHDPEQFNHQTSIVYKLEVPSLVSLVVYNPEFRCLTYLACGYKSKGYHRVVFDARDLPAGTYVARLRTETGIIKEYMSKVSDQVLDT